MIKKIISLLLLLPIFLWTSCAPNYAVEIPSDFKVIALSGGLAPGTSVLKLEIDSQGNCVYSESKNADRRQEMFRQIETFKIPQPAMRLIYRAIRENNFFSLNKSYVNKSVLDGNFAELTITESNRTHTVRTQNIKVERFDNVMIAINVTTPGMNKVMYNEINWFNK